MPLRNDLRLAATRCTRSPQGMAPPTCACRLGGPGGERPDSDIDLLIDFADGRGSDDYLAPGR